MVQTKITVKVYQPLLKSFNDKLESCFIKRDAFLNYMIKNETANLAREMKGLKLSNPARRYISGELKRLGTKPVNIVVDKDTADNLRKIVNESNMVRDSFINRLILFLNASDGLLKHLELPCQINDRLLSGTESMSTSPLQGIESIVHDPLFYLRTSIEELYGKSLYSFELPMILTGMSCYIDNTQVPGTDEFLKQQDENNEMLNLLKTELLPLNATGE
jgi:hypothetical protein